MWVITSGAAALFALDVVRPGFDFALKVRFNKFWGSLPVWRGDPDFDVVERVTATDQTRTQSACVLGRLVLLTGRPVATLTVEDLLAYRDAMLARGRQTVGLGHLWQCLADRGTVEGDLHRALRPGKKTVTELVDRYHIDNQRVRNMLIAYLTERSVAVDYSTLRSVTGQLCLNFWKQVEEIAPGIDTLDLPAGGRDGMEGGGAVAHRTGRVEGAPSGCVGHLHDRAGLLRRPDPTCPRRTSPVGHVGVPAAGERERGEGLPEMETGAAQRDARAHPHPGGPSE